MLKADPAEKGLKFVLLSLHLRGVSVECPLPGNLVASRMKLFAFGRSLVRHILRTLCRSRLSLPCTRCRHESESASEDICTGPCEPAVLESSRYDAGSQVSEVENTSSGGPGDGSLSNAVSTGDEEIEVQRALERWVRSQDQPGMGGVPLPQGAYACSESTLML